MQIYGFEIFFSELIQSYANPLMDLFFFTITQLGNPILWVLISAFFFWKGEERKSFFLMTLILIISACVGLIKPLIARLRPSTEAFKIFFIETDSIYGFPSGHAGIITGIYAFYENKLKKFNKIIFGILILLVLISRIYLGAHFLLDVIAGAIIGLILGKGIFFLQKLYENHELKSKKLLEEISLIGSVALLLVLIVLEQHPFATLIIGYFTGIFVFKLMGKNSEKIQGQKLIIKELIGFALLGILLSYSYFFAETTIQLIGFFIAGTFISLIYPIISEKIK
jgi:membrane-associated phospholipid phosphatase